jgi:cell cycle sensor histidine kinase DivJ
VGEPLALAGGIAASAAAIAGGGGLSQPATLLVLALVFETYWIERTSARAAIGGAAAAFALLLASLAISSFPGTIGTASALAWLAPALYFALVAPRISSLLRSQKRQAVEFSVHDLAQLTGAGVVKLSSSGEILDTTEEADALFGMPAGLLAGRSLFERVHVADRVALMNALANMTAENSRQRVDIRIRALARGAAGKDERFLPASLEFVRTQRFGEPTIVLVRDNSELARLRDQLADARNAADGTEVAKNRFLAAVSHELRTPLNSIIGFSDMMMNGMTGELSVQQREYAGLISSSGNHLLSVVNAILDVSRIESGAYSIVPEPFDVTEAVELCRSMMAHQAESQGLELTVSVRPDVRELAADRRAVQQIMINLLSNAIKFTPAGGSVSLDVFRRGGGVSFVVADTGIGIAEEDLGKLGRPFTQVSNDITRQFEGAGLGLSLVKGLVALHEGELAIESAPGAGTTVTVKLPLMGPNIESDDATPRMPSATVHAMEVKVQDETVRKTA